MEANRDEAERCYKLALDALDALDYTKAERMAKKSCYLHPTQKAKALFEKIQLITKGKSKSNTSSSPSSSPPHSFTFSSSSSSSKKSSTTTSNSLPPHTPEQLQLVKTINAHPLHAYYPILDLPQTASESDIKKAYRKDGFLSIHRFIP
ncbi:hypothetical protein HMI54_014081 [Coelomomyces lativittatus]|nr:hypothetical protein HMI54_014081 [Coelomomyces lativittatus]